TGTLTKTGGDTLILTGNNTYSGTTTISQGVLQIGNGGATGTLGTGNVVDNAVLAINRPTGITVANAISGAGALQLNGGGVAILTGTNTYTGGTFINNGILDIRNGAALSDTGRVTTANSSDALL